MFENIPHSSDEFRAQMLTECVYALKMQTYLDNHDSERFDYDGVDRSRVFHPEHCAFWFSWFNDNFREIFKALQLLEDERSKKLYLQIIAYRLAGHHSVKIDVGFDERGEEWMNYLGKESSSESTFELSGVFGKLKHFDFEYEGKRYRVDCLGLKYYLHRRQYFFHKDGVRICPEKGDYVIDGGACLGDSAVVFGNTVCGSGHVYCFDPIWEHIQAINHNAAQNPHLKIEVMPFGLSDLNVEAEPLKLNGYSPGFRTEERLVPLRKIDTLVETGAISKIDFVKLDVEGAELSTLKGAAVSIRRFRPKIAVSIYHKPNDIFEIPLFIKQTFLNYKMYLGHYTIHNEETVLYCQPQ
jgi:FkbM family methyltransferase